MWVLQTRRRFGGRQPLWGMGVRSRMRVILKPVEARARSADSRPEPGPLTNTESERMPCSIALWAASSAASWAAKGVDLRDPLKPFTPADDHATTFPETSVMVTMVLLNDAVMWAMPLWMFLRTFLALALGFGVSGAVAMAYAPVPSVFFLII